MKTRCRACVTCDQYPMSVLCCVRVCAYTSVCLFVCNLNELWCCFQILSDLRHRHSNTVLCHFCHLQHTGVVVSQRMVVECISSSGKLIFFTLPATVNPLLTANICVLLKSADMQGYGLENVIRNACVLYNALLFPAISRQIAGNLITRD